MGTITCREFHLYTEDGGTLVAKIRWDGANLLVEPVLAGVKVALRPFDRGLNPDGTPNREIVFNGELV